MTVEAALPASDLNPHATAFVPRPRPPTRANPASHRRGQASRARPGPTSKQSKAFAGERRDKRSPETEQEARKEGKNAKEETAAERKERAQRFNILVPEPDPQANVGELRMREKQVIWFRDDGEAGSQCAMTSDDPQFNRDLKRGERFAAIPPTMTEKEEVDFLRRQLEDATERWDDEDLFLEHALERHRLGQVTHVRPLPMGLNQLELGHYRGLFTLPWVMQVRRDFPDDAMKAKLALARATCLRGLTEENLDPEKGDVPICLINWGLLQDPNAAKRRQKEKQEEEKWQETTREVWMHQVVAEGIYEYQSQAMYPHEFGPPRPAVGEALDKWDYGSYMYHQQTARSADGEASDKIPPQTAHTRPRLRPIVKTNHLPPKEEPIRPSPPADCLSPVQEEPDFLSDFQGERGASNLVPVCAVRPSYRIKSTARNLRPIEAL